MTIYFIFVGSVYNHNKKLDLFGPDLLKRKIP